MAAIFDLDGEKLAATSGVTISKAEAQGLLKSLALPCTAIYALFLGEVKFQCMRVDDHTLIAKAPSEIFVAHRSNDVLICAFTDLGSKKSCLGCVRTFALKLNMEAVPDAVSAPSLI
nr:hypothetical protein BaRGS_032596 [Batillaria attramentaria]